MTPNLDLQKLAVELEPEVVSEEAENRRERDWAIIDYFERSYHILNAYLSNQRNNPQMQKMAVRCMALALNFPLAAGAEGPADLARKCGVKKQTAGKCLNHFIEQLNLEPLPFQRKSEARQNMSKARKEQVQRHD